MNVKQMSDEQLRIRVAELCGYWWLQSPDGKKEWLHPSHHERADGIIYAEDAIPMPDYPRDLNAIHEVEKLLGGKEQYYKAYLEALCCPGDRCVFATARQRCVAFVFAMEET